MNCRRFQKRLQEYVEGSLAASARAAADRHLARCTSCRQAVSQEQQLGQILAERLQQSTEGVRLHPAVRRRILAACQSIPAADSARVVGLWTRFVQPLPIAAALLLMAALLVIHFFFAAKVQETATARSDGRALPSAASIEVSYRVPTYTFRKEGNLVVDTLSYETIVASGTLWTGFQGQVQDE